MISLDCWDGIGTLSAALERGDAMAGRTIDQLITPSPERALELDKAYRVIVQEQSFIFGRDATTKPPINVYETIDSATAPTLPPEYRYEHDIRLNWSRQSPLGLQLFEGVCLECHGEIAQGNHIGPDIRKVSVSTLKHALAGYDEMPEFEMTLDEIDALQQYIASFGR